MPAWYLLIRPVASEYEAFEVAVGAESQELIRQWWTALNGRSIVWEVFYEDETVPVWTDISIVRHLRLTNDILCWQQQSLSDRVSIPVRELMLDLRLQQLDIFPKIASPRCLRSVSPKIASPYRYRVRPNDLPKSQSMPSIELLLQASSR